MRSRSVERPARPHGVQVRSDSDGEGWGQGGRQEVTEARRLSPADGSATAIRSAPDAKRSTPVPCATGDRETKFPGHRSQQLCERECGSAGVCPSSERSAAAVPCHIAWQAQRGAGGTGSRAVHGSIHDRSAGYGQRDAPPEFETPPLSPQPLRRFPSHSPGSAGQIGTRRMQKAPPDDAVRRGFRSSSRGDRI